MHNSSHTSRRAQRSGIGGVSKDDLLAKIGGPANMDVYDAAGRGKEQRWSAFR